MIRRAPSRIVIAPAALIARFPSRERRRGTSAARAAWRIGLSLARRRSARGALAVVDIGGARAHADLRTPGGLELYRYGFEIREAKLLRRLLRPGDVVVDGGANVGLFALLAAVAVQPGGRVLACEPGPGTMALLRANVAANRFAGLECHRVALSDRAGAAPMVVFEAGSGLASFAPQAGGGETIEVPTTTLDALTAPFGDRVAVVKLDIEGAEVRAVRGAGALVQRSAPLFLVEVEPAHLARQGCSSEDLRDALAPAGYVAFSLEPGGGLATLQRTWQAPDPECPNLLLVPPSRAERVRGLVVR